MKVPSNAIPSAINYNISTEYYSLYRREIDLLEKRQKYIDSILDGNSSRRLHVKNDNGTIVYCYTAAQEDEPGREHGLRQEHGSGREYGPRREHYLKKSDPMLPELILNYCAQHTRSVVSSQLSTLKRTPSKYDPTILESHLISLERKFGNLMPSGFLSTSSWIKKWEDEPYITNTRWDPDKKQFKTLKGDMVRSKIEMITADMLYTMSIPYHYEQQVILSDGRDKYPDFTMISPHTRKMYYLEVCGRMSDPVYVDRLLDKIVGYSKIGICQGDNLMLIFESDTIPFDTECLRQMLAVTVLKPKRF